MWYGQGFDADGRRQVGGPGAATGQMSRGITAGSSTAPPTIGRRATGSPWPCPSSKWCLYHRGRRSRASNDEDRPSYYYRLPDLAPGDGAAAAGGALSGKGSDLRLAGSAGDGGQRASLCSAAAASLSSLSRTRAPADQHA